MGAAARRRRGGAARRGAHLQRARHKVVVVRLVEEHVLAVARRLGGKVLQHAVRPDAVLQAQLPPELHADCGMGGGREREEEGEARGSRSAAGAPSARQRGRTLVAALADLQRYDFAGHFVAKRAGAG